LTNTSFYDNIIKNKIIPRRIYKWRELRPYLPVTLRLRLKPAAAANARLLASLQVKLPALLLISSAKSAKKASNLGKNFAADFSAALFL